MRFFAPKAARFGQRSALQTRLRIRLADTSTQSGLCGNHSLKISFRGRDAITGMSASDPRGHLRTSVSSAYHASLDNGVPLAADRGKEGPLLTRFGTSPAKSFSETVRFLSCASEGKPFLWMEWPQAPRRTMTREFFYMVQGTASAAGRAWYPQILRTFRKTIVQSPC